MQKAQRAHIDRLINRSGTVFCVALAVLMASASMHTPSWAVLAGGSVTGLWLLLVVLWQYHSRNVSAPLIGLLVFNAVNILVIRRVETESSALWLTLHYVSAMMLVFACLTLLIRAAKPFGLLKQPD